MRNVLNRLVPAILLLAAVACTQAPPPPVVHVDLPRSDQGRDLFVDISMDRQGSVYLEDRRLDRDWPADLRAAIRASTVAPDATAMTEPVIYGSPPRLTPVPMALLRFDRALSITDIKPVLDVCLRNRALSLGLVTGDGSEWDLNSDRPGNRSYDGLAVRLFSPVEADVSNERQNDFEEMILRIRADGRLVLNREQIALSDLTDTLQAIYSARIDQRLCVSPDGAIRYDRLIEVLSEVWAVGSIDIRLVLPDQARHIPLTH